MLYNPQRCAVEGCLDDVRSIVLKHADVVAELDTDEGEIDPALRPTIAVIVGGDGTLLAQARRLVDLDLPLIGVNFGRLGFLAEFDVESLRNHAEPIFDENPPIRAGMLIRALVVDANGNERTRMIAVNDCTITAGPPFRMIELAIDLDGQPGPVLTGDGMIVATPTGSTAYNVSAGGPIVEPAVESMIITPLSAHSLAFRPVVVSAATTILVRVRRANAGTTLVIDGQEQVTLQEGERVRLCRDSRRIRLITNPSVPYWRILLDKMRWAAPPTYRDRGA